LCTFTCTLRFFIYPTHFHSFVNSLSPPAYSHWPDAALLQALLADDRAAFAELYERYWYRVFALAHRRLKSRETAEELVQDLFATLWLKRHEHTIEHLEHYLMAAISRRVIGHLRAHQVRTAYADYCRWYQASTTEETEQALAAADLTEAFTQALLHLPEQSREIFRLSRLEHFSVQEIALRLNVSAKTVEYHITKSLRLLRTHLRDFVLLAILFISA
jgi:RNA polymerase sigma-70 factor (family 1)